MKRGAPGFADPPTLDEIKGCIEKRLFIGRLPATVSDDEVREVYGAYGALKECRVLPEKGVAFVSYDTWAAAHKALLSTDNQACLRSCNGQPIAVSFAERSGSSGRGSHYAKGSEHSRIFVGGLPESCTDSDLKTLFDVFGKVEAANLLAPKGNRRCGFVNFSLWGEALDAIELLDGQKYPGNEDRRSGSEAMTVVLASPREGYSNNKVRRVDAFGGELALPAGLDEGPAADPEFESLKVAYLSAVDGDTPAGICDELHRKIMARRPATRQLLAIAPFAQSALLGGGQEAMPMLAAGCEERDAARLFVGGLPYECTDEELKALVEQVQFSLPPFQCQLLECRVLPGRGCGYVRFSSWEAAAEAIQALNERAVSGWLTPLRVRWATPKGQSPFEGTAAAAAVAQPQEKLLQLALQQVVGGAAHADGLSTALTALLGGAAPGAAAAQLAANNASVAQLTAAAAVASSLGSIGAVGSSQEEAVIAAQGLDPKRLFVGQLSRELTDKAALARLFEPFGQIESLRWLEDKGVAYVQYADFGAANAALTTLGGKHIPGISRDQGLNINFSRMR